MGLIPGSGRSPGRGNGNPLQYSWLESPMDRGAWWATGHRAAKNWTWLSNWAHVHTHSHTHVSHVKGQYWSLYEIGRPEGFVTLQSSSPPAIEIDQRPGKKFRQGFIGPPAAAGGVRRSTRVGIGVCPEVGLEGWQVAWPPLRWCWGQGACAVSAFVPDHLLSLWALQKGQLGFLVSLYLLVHNLAQLLKHVVIFSPIQFLCILLLEERCVQMQTLQQGVPGPSLSQFDARSRQYQQLMKGMFTYKESGERPAQLQSWWQMPRTMEQVCQAASIFF